METRNSKNTVDAPQSTTHKVFSGYASIEELIEEIWDDSRNARRFSRLWNLCSEVLWEAAAAVACASGGLLTIGHPRMTLAVAGAVPFAIQALRYAAALVLSHGLSKLIERLFH